MGELLVPNDPLLEAIASQAIQTLTECKPVEIRMLSWSLCRCRELTEAWKLFDVMSKCAWLEPDHGGPSWRALLAEMEHRELIDGEVRLLSSFNCGGLLRGAIDVSAFRL